MLQKNVPLKNLNNYKIGGSASYLFEIKNIEDLKSGLLEFYSLFHSEKDSPPIFILGGGTNILVDDKGFQGLVIRNLLSYIESANGEDLIVGSGTDFSELLKFCIENSLSGLEWAGGLPGSVGGAIRGNAGAYKGEIKDNLKSVTSINLKNFDYKNRSNIECNFGYRTSVFKTDEAKNEFITEAIFSLKKGSKEEISRLIQEKIDHRKARHPLEYPNIGSIFKNIPFGLVPDKFKDEFKQYIKEDPFPVLPVAKLFSIAGFKGKRVGGVVISEKHPNYFVNIDNGSSEDVRNLVEFAKKEIKDRYDIYLEEEIYYL